MDYVIELSEIVGMNIVPKVFFKMLPDLLKLNVQFPNSFRDFNYTISDDETFERKQIAK